MKYLQFTFRLAPSSGDAQDVLCALLGEAGFDSFEPSDDGRGPLQAYVRPELFSEEALADALAAFPFPDTEITHTRREADDRDWNAVWEQNYFQPLVVDGRCVVAGTMHKDAPKAEYRITIDPHMSFGTGHHATTSQMLSELLKADVAGRRVLDMGCGTGILAILARMRGARECLAVDYDEWCVKNTLENIALNAVDGIEVRLGDATALAGEAPFDLVLANINRNILLADMAAYTSVMAPGARLLTSGYYTEDVDALRRCAERHGLRFLHTRSLDNWACTGFEKA
ncbi:MAG: 50S ribosomal protein L11 methyltransferase [Bacteroidaceae bacterium]|nr:50S ribosomal protein L11 methyltransferase [Bacteroidaceae bacterium]